MDQDGYSLYKRKDNGNVIEKNDVFLDNCYVIPYNLKLLLRYQAHINIEWCNQTPLNTYLSEVI